jgi:hypothetical protein
MQYVWELVEPGAALTMPVEIQTCFIPVATQYAAAGWLGVEGSRAVFLVGPSPAETITAAKPTTKRLRAAQRLLIPS